MRMVTETAKKTRTHNGGKSKDQNKDENLDTDVNKGKKNPNSEENHQQFPVVDGKHGAPQPVSEASVKRKRSGCGASRESPA